MSKGDFVIKVDLAKLEKRFSASQMDRVALGLAEKVRKDSNVFCPMKTGILRDTATSSWKTSGSCSSTASCISAGRHEGCP